MSASLSSHILDTHLGRPAADIAVTLRRVDNHSNATLLAHGTTNSDGRVSPDSWQFDEAVSAADRELSTGRYTLTFDTQAYFDTSQSRVRQLFIHKSSSTLWSVTTVTIMCPYY